MQFTLRQEGEMRVLLAEGAIDNGAPGAPCGGAQEAWADRPDLAALTRRRRSGGHRGRQADPPVDGLHPDPQRLGLL
jgi:hypothetical protein